MLKTRNHELGPVNGLDPPHTSIRPFTLPFTGMITK